MPTGSNIIRQVLPNVGYSVVPPLHVEVADGVVRGAWQGRDALDHEFEKAAGPK